MLAGWDGEEYGLLGSTEWAEQYERDLQRNAVAYSNLDGAGGFEFAASGVPQLDAALVELTKAVQDPRSGKPVYDVWTADGTEEPEIGRLGSGSDYTAFLDHIGVPSLEAGFTNDASAGTYHSAYDDTYNMEKHLDPGYLGHAGSSLVTGTMALRLANADILPFRYSDYAAAVVSYVEELQGIQQETDGAAQLDLSVLLAAAERWGARPRSSRRVAARCSRPATSQAAAQARAIARINRVLMRQERALTTPRGLPGPAVVPPPGLCARPGHGLRGAVPAGVAGRGRAGRRGDRGHVPRPAARVAARRDAARAAGGGA